MRAFLEAVYEYPWVVTLLVIAVIVIIKCAGEAFAEARGHGCKCGGDDE